MLLCGIGAKPVAHLIQDHLLQWEAAKVKQLMTSNITLTVLNLHKKTPTVLTCSTETPGLPTHPYPKVLQVGISHRENLCTFVVCTFVATHMV